MGVLERCRKDVERFSEKQAYLRGTAIASLPLLGSAFSNNNNGSYFHDFRNDHSFEVAYQYGARFGVKLESGILEIGCHGGSKLVKTV